MRACCLWVAVLAASLAQSGPVQAQAPLDLVARASEAGGFGRIELTFSEIAGVTARTAGSVLIIEFDRPVRIKPEKIAASLPGYVAAARADPGERSMRLALTQPVRIDIKEAAERVFLDLLPATWRQPPPPLPGDVVRDLARRAREAQTAIKAAETRAARPEQHAVHLRLAEAERRIRLVFDLHEPEKAGLVQQGQGLALTFPANHRLDPAEMRSRLAGIASEVRVEDANDGAVLHLTLREARIAKADQEDGAWIVDLDLPAPPVPAQSGAQAPRPADAPKLPPAVAAPPAHAKAEPPPAAPPALDEAAQPPPVRPASPEAAVVLDVRESADGVALSVRPRVPMAVLERGGEVWAVLQGVRSLRLPVAAQQGLFAGFSAEHLDAATLLRVVPREPGLLSVSADAGGWSIQLGPSVAAAVEPIGLSPAVGADGRRLLRGQMPQAGDPLALDDPQSGGRLMIVPMSGAPHAMLASRALAEAALLRTALGFAALATAEDVRVLAELDSFVLMREGGLSLSSEARPGAASSGNAGDLVVQAQAWTDDRRGAVRDLGRDLLAAAANAAKRDRAAARLRYAQFLLANGLGPEASGVLGLTAQDDPVVAQGKTLLLLKAIAAVLSEDLAEAARVLAQPALSLEPEAILWRTHLDARNRRFGPALVGFRQSLTVLDRYPEQLQALLRPSVVTAALEGGDAYLASQQVGELERLDANERDPGLIHLLQGRIAEATGRAEEALSAYGGATKSMARPVEAEARLHLALLRLKTNPADAERLKAELETIAMIWRRGEVEVRARARLSELYAGETRWRDAFAMTKRAVEIQPEHPLTRKLQDETAQRFEALFLGGQADRLPRIEALAIHEEFRSLIPVGARGDEIVRRLAERLYDLDLLEQATNLLTHQVHHRLKGVARSQTAARLAVVHLVNGKPQEALQALKSSRLSGLPPALRRARVILEARTLAELSRTELAMETLAAETGPDVERLRADILWRGKRWRDAAETYERALAERWRDATPLEEAERGDVVRAGVAYVLASDRLGLDRLRTKFLPKMADSPDAETFKLVSLDNISRATDFREVARGVVSAQTLSDFLDAYRKRYPDTAGGKRAREAG